jgi:hypothetical protein
MGKPEGERPLGRDRRRWEDHIKMGLGGVDRIHLSYLAQDRDQWMGLVNTVINPRVP